MESVLKKKHWLLMSTVAGVALLGSPGAAHAFVYQFDNGVVVRFDNTLQYSVEQRVSPTDAALTKAASAVNTNDGDENLRAGIVENRFDVITRFDISDNGYGFDASADSYYDFVYTSKTQQAPGNKTYNSNEPSDKYPTQTVTQAGKDIQLRNLFIYGSNTFGNVPVTVRVGRLVNLYGESLFFAANGISYGQAPLDIARASSVPNTQAKDLFLPVGTATIQAQLTDSLQVEAYYQFEWVPFNFKPVGSYFSTVDLVGPGANAIIAVPGGGPRGVNIIELRGRDLSGADTGQFGGAVHYDPIGSQWDFGLYALQYNDTEPQVYTEQIRAAHLVPGQGLVVGQYQLAYANGIQIYGASTSTTIGALNLAGEVSVRAHEDLETGTPVPTQFVVPLGDAMANGVNSRFARGNVLHYQASEIYLGPKTPFWDTSSVTGEIAGENLLGFTAYRQYYNREYKHMALGLRAVASVTYYDVYAGLDVSPGIGLGYNFMGRAPDTAGFNNTGIDRGGDITFSLKGTLQNNWFGGISYTRYIAPPARDPLADRDFVAFNIERTF